MSDPVISLSGLYDTDGNLLGFETPLYIAQSGTQSVETDTEPESIPSLGEDETALTPLEAEKDFMYEGIINPIALPNEEYPSNGGSDNGNDNGEDGSDNVIEAFREYVFELESLVLPDQKAGYELQDDVSGFTLTPTNPIGVLVGDVTWTVSWGEGVRGEWSVEPERADGIPLDSEIDDRQEYITEQFSRVEDVDETLLEIPGESTLPLGGVEEMSVNRSIDIETEQIIHAFDVPQLGLFDSGITVEIQLSGTVTEEQAFGSLSDFVQRLHTEMHGREVSLTEEVTGRSFVGAVSDSSTEFNESTQNYVEYDITFTVGDVFVGEGEL